MPSLTPSPNRVINSRTSPTYSASITIDSSAGQWHIVTVTNSTAFTVNAPTNPPGVNGTAEMTIEIFNNTGGAIGTITWNAAFKFPVAWVNPAAGKKRAATFKWSGTAWVCISALGDY